MAKVTALAECPPLPSGPVDFDALRAACLAGATAQEAINAATANNPKPEEVVLAEQPAAPTESPATEAEIPALDQE